MGLTKRLPFLRWSCQGFNRGQLDFLFIDHGKDADLPDLPTDLVLESDYRGDQRARG